jgi:ATP-dependent DNA ligase
MKQPSNWPRFSLFYRFAYLPTLIAEIEFRAWTQDGKLRHAPYKGLREVQANAAVYKIQD